MSQLVIFMSDIHCTVMYSKFLLSTDKSTKLKLSGYILNRFSDSSEIDETELLLTY